MRTVSSALCPTMVAVVLGLTCLTPPADAADYLPIGAYLFDYDGKILDDAKIYHSPTQARILVVASELPQPVLVIPQRKLVRTLDPKDVTENPDGSLTVADGAKKTTVGSYELVDNLPAFTLGGKPARFLNKPPLLGPQHISAFEAYDPAYRRRADAYEPYAVYLDSLRQADRKVRVQIYFGSWCHVCARLVPHIIRVAEELEGSNIAFDFFGLGEPLSDSPEAKRLGITAVPTGIIYVEGKEVNRVTSHSWRFPDMALYNALGGG